MHFLKHVNLEKVLVLDIETVPQTPALSDLSDRFQELWEEKCHWLNMREQEPIPAEELYPRAGIYAEFGKIVCISAGIFNRREKQLNLRIKSYYSDDEQELLLEFRELLNRHFNSPRHYLCAHNGKEFDFPYLARRMMINDMRLPRLLDNSGKKSWETGQLLDTLHLWRFGDYKNYTSLNLLTASLGIPTSKDDIKGSDVHRVYWQDQDLERIAHYCQKDVVAVAQLLMKFTGQDLLDDDRIIFVNEENVPVEETEKN